MLIDFVIGQTGIILRVKLRNSSVTTGAGLTGLSSASAGLIISTIADNEAVAVPYTQAGATIDTITTLGLYAAPAAGRCRFREVDPVNHKGIYEIQIDNARFAVAGSKSLLVSLSGAANLAECDSLIPLRAFNPYAAGVVVATNNDKAGYSLSASGLDAVTVEPGINARQALSPILAASAGLISGQENNAPTIKAGGAGSAGTTRISATTDANGNRLSVALAIPA